MAFKSIGAQSSASTGESSSVTESQSQQVVEKSVPKLIGKSYAEVVSNPDYQLDYTFVKLEAYSNEYTEGVICDQSPDAGDTIIPGSTIYLTVSLGARATYVPAGVIGISYNDAVKKLDEAGINYRREYVDQTREYVAGVVAGLSIEEGKEVSLKDDVLIVYVSNDKPLSTPTPEPTATPSTEQNNTDSSSTAG